MADAAGNVLDEEQNNLWADAQKIAEEAISDPLNTQQIYCSGLCAYAKELIERGTSREDAVQQVIVRIRDVRDENAFHLKTDMKHLQRTFHRMVQRRALLQRLEQKLRNMDTEDQVQDYATIVEVDEHDRAKVEL